MATLKTAEVTAIDTGLVRQRLQENVASAQVLHFEAVYTTTGSEAASGDTIAICDLPIGAVVLPELCRVSNEASVGGSVVAIPTIGDAVDADRYSATSISIHSSNAADQAVTPNVADGVITRTPIVAATKRIVAAFSRTNALTAGKKIKFLIVYRPRG